MCIAYGSRYVWKAASSAAAALLHQDLLLRLDRGLEILQRIAQLAVVAISAFQEIFRHHTVSMQCREIGGFDSVADHDPVEQHVCTTAANALVCHRCPPVGWNGITDAEPARSPPRLTVSSSRPNVRVVNRKP